jgi:hypothetical protein
VIKFPTQTIQDRNDLFCLLVSEISVHHGVRTLKSKVPHLVAARKQREIVNPSGLFLFPSFILSRSPATFMAGLSPQLILSVKPSQTHIEVGVN